MKARYILAALAVVTLAGIVQGGTISFSNDADPLDDLSEEAFEEYFHEEDLKDKDPEEFEKRAEELKDHEEMVREVNKEYQAGNMSYFDKINALSDIPENEFEIEKTGANSEPRQEYARGLIFENFTDPDSEAYFDRLRYNRAQLPESYSSVDLGYVSPIKSQETCGSCVAFASMAAIEICFKKITGVEDDYSEQQMVDCGYLYKCNEWNGCPGGCNGAPIKSYVMWAKEQNIEFAHESQYPYLDTNTNYNCPHSLPVHNRGARVNGAWATLNGDEELLKKVVYEHGAAVVGIQAGKNAGEARGGLSEYAGGVYTGCTSGDIDHAVTVVGWGRENNLDYWLIKNSWGKQWGDKGFLKLARGYNMCGIGPRIATVACETVAGATDPPQTTPYHCKDIYPNCAQLAQTSCWHPDTAENCEKSCKLCPGMTPVESYSCYDYWNNCYSQLAPQVCSTSDADKCMKTCGTCPARTPVPNPTTPTPTTPYTPPAVASCTCSNGVDYNGYGNCDKTYQGKTLCYVNEPSTCSDLQETTFGQYSFEACSGTYTPPVDATCTCSEGVDYNGYGKCGKTYLGKTLCYVNEPSTCSDVQESTFGQYSFEACAETEKTTTCTCSDGVDYNGYGRCGQTYQGKALCYVNEPSTCFDLQESYFGKWSFQACGA